MSLRVLTGHPGPPTGVDVDRRFSRAVACRRTAGQEQRSLRRSGLRPHAWLDIGGHSEPKRSQGLCGSDSDYCRRAVHASESDTSSGSRSASSSIEPLRSTKSTVTCLRSPSRVARPARIFSARCSGGWGAAIGAAPASRWPQLSQCLAAGGLAVAHDGHVTVSKRGAAHSAQKRAPSRFTWPHDGQFMA